MCTLCESNGEQYWEFPVFARSEDSQGSARIKASKDFAKLDLQNNSPTKSGQEDKVISNYFMMVVMMMKVMMMVAMMMMVLGVGWSGSKSCSSPIWPSTWTNVSKSSGDDGDDDYDNGDGDDDDDDNGDGDGGPPVLERVQL